MAFLTQTITLADLLAARVRQVQELAVKRQYAVSPEKIYDGRSLVADVLSALDRRDEAALLGLRGQVDTLYRRAWGPEGEEKSDPVACEIAAVLDFVVGTVQEAARVEAEIAAQSDAGERAAMAERDRPIVVRSTVSAATRPVGQFRSFAAEF